MGSHYIAAGVSGQLGLLKSFVEKVGTLTGRTGPTISISICVLTDRDADVDTVTITAQWAISGTARSLLSEQSTEAHSSEALALEANDFSGKPANEIPEKGMKALRTSPYYFGGALSVAYQEKYQIIGGLLNGTAWANFLHPRYWNLVKSTGTCWIVGEIVGGMLDTNTVGSHRLLFHNYSLWDKKDPNHRSDYQVLRYEIPFINNLMRLVTPLEISGNVAYQHKDVILVSED